MSLSLSFRPESFKRTDNMIPVREGVFRTRPGATQLVTGNITAATSWDGRVLFYRDGRALLWDTVEHDVGGAGVVLDSVAFQALLADAVREDRLYVADGVNPPWFIRYVAGSGYQRVNVVNTVLDPAGTPYPVPVAWSIETWRNRLWIGDGSNRIVHSDVDQPHAFDPLFALEFQGGDRAPVKALIAQNDYLAVGTQTSIWSVTGTSQYNWERPRLTSDVGVAGPRAMAGDGDRLLFASKTGVSLTGVPTQLGDDRLDPIFQVPDADAQVMLSLDGRHAYALIFRRLFVIHIASQSIGEIAEDVAGILRVGRHLAWYGSNGLWVANRSDGIDTPLRKAPTRIASVIETWTDLTPERRLLERSSLLCRGEVASPITYTALVDGKSSAATVTGAPAQTPFTSMWDGDLLDWDADPMSHEFRVYRSGTRFVHRISCNGLMELISFNPQFRVPLDD